MHYDLITLTEWVVSPIFSETPAVQHGSRGFQFESLAKRLKPYIRRYCRDIRRYC